MRRSSKRCTAFCENEEGRGWSISPPLDKNKPKRNAFMPRSVLDSVEYPTGQEDKKEVKTAFGSCAKKDTFGLSALVFLQNRNLAGSLFDLSLSVISLLQLLQTEQTFPILLVMGRGEA